VYTKQLVVGPTIFANQLNKMPNQKEIFNKYPKLHKWFNQTLEKIKQYKQYVKIKNKEFIKTLKNGIHDRVRFTNAKWEDMLTYVINKYNKSVHSSIGMSPIEAHKDENRKDVMISLKLKSVNNRKYTRINEGDYVKIYKKGKDNIGSRKGYVPKWSEEKYKVEKIDKDITLQTYYILEGLTRRFNRHEILLIND